VSNDVIEAEPELSDAEITHAAAVNADIEEVNTPGVSSLIDEVIIVMMMSTTKVKGLQECCQRR
jgi:ribosomal silencing factor RsfS